MEQTLAMTAVCREGGLFVVPIFYPVVPFNAPRIRLNVSAAHDDTDIDRALAILRRAAQHAGLLAKPEHSPAAVSCAPV